METPIGFYCIRLIREDGTRGWLIDSPEGIKLAVGGVHSDITQFATEQDALKFIRDRKLERKGIKAYVRTNQELLETITKIGERGASVVTKPIYHLENEKGEKLFYDSKMDAYYFKEMGDIGCGVWETEELARLFVKEYKFQESMIFLVKRFKAEREKKLIQVYGSKKNPDGTMSEPEHIDIQEGTEWK
jgi:hypothetical protein